MCWTILIIAAPLFFLYGLLTGKHLGTIKERFGFFPFSEKIGAGPKRLWFHAASIGEVQVAKSIIAETTKLIPDASFILSTVTEQGQLVANKQLGREVLCIYAPIDLPWVINRFIRALKPTTYICLETELWPNMLKTAAENGVQLLLLNGRMAENSFKNYCRFPKFTREVLNYFSAISCITSQDRERFKALGACPKKFPVNGNAKYDNVLLPIKKSNSFRNTSEADPKNFSEEIKRWYRKKLFINTTDIVLIAGSTHEGEEKQLIQVFNTVRTILPGFIMIIAPRHISRVNKIESLLNENKLDYQLYSSLSEENRCKDIILVDIIGELANLYSIATYIFCGGSLVPKGGHNIMEPAAWGKPVFYGPNMNDFKDAQYLLESVQAGFLVRDETALIDKIVYFHKDQNAYRQASANAFKVAQEQHGSAKRQAMIIKDLLNQNQAIL